MYGAAGRRGRAAVRERVGSVLGCVTRRAHPRNSLGRHPLLSDVDDLMCEEIVAVRGTRPRSVSAEHDVVSTRERNCIHRVRGSHGIRTDVSANATQIYTQPHLHARAQIIRQRIARPDAARCGDG